MLGSQLSFMIMSATDTIVAGRAGADQLAGLVIANSFTCLLYTSPSPRDGLLSRMPSSA